MKPKGGYVYIVSKKIERYCIKALQPRKSLVKISSFLTNETKWRAIRNLLNGADV